VDLDDLVRRAFRSTEEDLDRVEGSARRAFRSTDGEEDRVEDSVRPVVLLLVHTVVEDLDHGVSSVGVGREVHAVRLSAQVVSSLDSHPHPLHHPNVGDLHRLHRMDGLHRPSREAKAGTKFSVPKPIHWENCLF
jgi:hypothetical protein